MKRFMEKLVFGMNHKKFFSKISGPLKMTLFTERFDVIKQVLVNTRMNLGSAVGEPNVQAIPLPERLA